MREILFRGKSLDNGEWVYGVPLTNNENTLYFVDDFHNCFHEEILPETFGAYTGLSKNGVKIFEGDIIKYHNQFTGKTVILKVIHSQNKCRFSLMTAYGIYLNSAENT